MKKVTSILFIITVFVSIMCSTLSVSAETVAGVSKPGPPIEIRKKGDSVGMNLWDCGIGGGNGRSVWLGDFSLALGYEFKAENNGDSFYIMASNGVQTIEFYNEDAFLNGEPYLFKNEPWFPRVAAKGADGKPRMDQLSVKDVELDTRELCAIFGFEVEYYPDTRKMILVPTETAVLHRYTPGRDCGTPTTKLFSFCVDDRGEDIEISYYGDKINFTDEKPFIDENNRLQIPVRALSEAIGYDVYYDPSTKAIDIKCDGFYMLLYMDQNVLYSMEGVITMDTSPTIINDRTYVPVDYIAKALRTKVIWE